MYGVKQQVKRRKWNGEEPCAEAVAENEILDFSSRNTVVDHLACRHFKKPQEDTHSLHTVCSKSQQIVKTKNGQFLSQLSFDLSIKLVKIAHAPGPEKRLFCC